MADRRKILNKEYKDAVIQHNKKMNGGVVRSDKTGSILRDNVVFTTTKILSNSEVALRALHDDEGNWEIIGETDVEPNTLALVSFSEILSLDSTLEEIKGLKIGQKLSRKTQNSPWG